MNSLLTLSVLTAALTSAAPGRTWGSLTFSACALRAEGQAASVDAQCATLDVPEDRSKPGGRHLSLAIAWVPSRSFDPAPDPVFMLAGGPGQSARESYPSIAPAFAETLRKRHVVLVDQRGTGSSHKLACKAPGEADGGVDGGEDAHEARSSDGGVSYLESAQFAGDCAAKLDADTRFYTTAEAIEDLDAVRAALGAPQVNLVGISYGTRVAQQYAKRYPAQTRTLVLDGVVPNQLVLGSEHAKNLEAALDLQFARCAADKACSQQLGAPRTSLDALLATLRKAPVEVDYRDPITGVRAHGKLGPDDLAGVVRLFSYSPVVATVLPWALHEAANGHWEDLMAQARMLRGVIGEQIVPGVQWSVMCAEDADELRSDPADAKTVLGTGLVDAALAQCAAWPHGKRAADFREPLKGDVPVLLLSGEFDPVTPPRYAEQVKASLPKARHLIARGAGHNVLPMGCLPRLLAKYLKTADALGLDASCLDTLTYAAPFSGPWGWEP